jgi:hypothetical protein
MQNVIERLDALLSRELNPAELAKKEISVERAEALRTDLKKEISGLLKFLWERIPELQGLKQIRILVIQYQGSLSALLDQVLGWRKDPLNQSAVMDSLYGEIAGQLEQTIFYFRKHFGQWMKALPPNESLFFIQTALNEAETAAFLRALVDTQAVLNHSYTSLLEGMAPLIATKQKKGLKARSMLKSKVKLTPNMKKRVKDLLMAMAREVDGY